MFEGAEVGNQLSKEEYKTLTPQLRVDLINAQYDLRTAEFPVILLIAGDDWSACNEIIDVLHAWLDARYLDTQVFLQPTEEDRERPRFWRYWRALPPKGTIGIYLGAWALSVVTDAVSGRIHADELYRRINHVHRFERALADDGALLLKFWLHLPKEALKKRLKRAKKQPDTQLFVDEKDWALYDIYDQAIPVVEHFLRKTNGGATSWEVVESTDARYRNVVVAKAILSAISARLSEQTASATVSQPHSPLRRQRGTRPRNALQGVDLSAALPKDDYKAQRTTLQARLSRLSRECRNKKLSSVLVFEGWDAAGKGGVIRRLTGAMLARDYRLLAVAAPSEEERARHYLWRFWRHLQPQGRMLIFDRSWYGRVLVERVEGFASAEEWRRAYAEINDFEEQLVEHGMVLLKFWLHIDPDEQLRRFQAREKTPYKKYKITEEDYRNREKWDDYVEAVNDMVSKTSSEIAPWHLVAANDKRWARIEVLETVCGELQRALEAK